jgi:hypothetical protein
MERIIRPMEHPVVRLPKGTQVNLRQGQDLHLEEKLSPEQQDRYNVWMETFTGTVGVVTPVSFDHRLDQEQITIVDGQITGSLDRTTYPFKALREELGLSLSFTNQPLLVSVRGGEISGHMLVDHEFIGKIDPDIRYWVLVKRRKDGLVTIPGKLLNGDHAASEDPLAANRITSLSETGINPSTVGESAVYVSFEHYWRGGRATHLGDVNFVSAGECSLTVPEVIAGFGDDPHTESLVFVAQRYGGVARLFRAGMNIWPNLIELLLEDLKQ